LRAASAAVSAGSASSMGRGSSKFICATCQNAATTTASLPGLTRQSILSQAFFVGR
jgi:hypothetical protein